MFAPARGLAAGPALVARRAILLVPGPRRGAAVRPGGGHLARARQRDAAASPATSHRTAPPTPLFAPTSFWNQRLARHGAARSELAGPRAGARRRGPARARRRHRSVDRDRARQHAGLPGRPPASRACASVSTAPRIHGGRALQRALRRGADPARRQAGDRARSPHDRSCSPRPTRCGSSSAPAATRTDGTRAGAARSATCPTSPGYYTASAWPGATRNWGATASSLPVIGGTILLDELQARTHRPRAGDQPAGAARGRLRVAGAAHRRHRPGDHAARGSAAAPRPHAGRRPPWTCPR